jgi:hypothetical protein
MLKVRQIDSYTKNRIQRVLEVLPEIERYQREAPDALKEATNDLQRQIAQKSIPEKIRTLRNLRGRYREQRGLYEGIELAAQILEDGQSSIYSPDFSFYQMLEEGAPGHMRPRASFGDLADVDTVGGAIGGGIGFAGGVVTAGPGAVVGAAGASAGFAIGWELDWLGVW